MERLECFDRLVTFLTNFFVDLKQLDNLLLIASLIPTCSATDLALITPNEFPMIAMNIFAKIKNTKIVKNIK